MRFEIERHGATVNGSKTAEVHLWIIDVDAGTRTLESTTVRRIEKFARSINAAEIDRAAEQVATIVKHGVVNDPRVEWTKSGHARIRTSEFLPPAAKQTQAGRVKRFHAALESKLPGWKRNGAIYSRVS